jgi:Mrp family chromosome partitioning ATPase
MTREAPQPSSSLGTGMTTSSEAAFEPTVLGAVSRYRVLVAAVTLTSLLCGVLWIMTRPVRYAATASLVVEDPRGSGLLGDGSGASQPERYVADQVAILESIDVAEEARSRVQREFPTFDPSIRDFRKNISVASSVADNSKIVISYRHSDPDVAVFAANSMVEAYSAVRRDEAATNYGAAVEELDGLLASLNVEIAAAAERVAALEDPDAATLQEQARLIDRRSDLNASREQLALQAQLDSSGIVQADEALDPPDQASNGAGRILVLAGILGLAGGTGAAYALALRQRRFTSRYQPEQVLRAPLLSDVPVFYGADSDLPVLSSPVSAAAESFRFAATSIQIQTDSGEGVVTTLVSANSGDGKSVVAANTAMAIAQTGRRTLVIDADGEKQDVSAILGVEANSGRGLTDVLRGAMPFQDAVRDVINSGGTELALLPFGDYDELVNKNLTSQNAPELLDRVLEEARGRYDFIIVDMPPLPRSALAATLLSRADRALVVVVHDGLVSEQEELAERIDFIGTPAVGYIYNKAPLRAHWLTPYVTKDTTKRRTRGSTLRS